MGPWLFAFALASADECDEEAGVCLLSLRSRRLAPTAEGGVGAWQGRQVELRAWNAEHSVLKRDLARHHDWHGAGWSTYTPQSMLETWHASTRLGSRSDKLADSWLDDFIGEQNGNTDACHAKVMEAKRTLDGLGAKVLALSDAVEGHEAVIEGNTQLIRDGLDNKAGNDDQRIADDKKCEDEYQAAIDENSKYTLELDELDQMANPAVRSSIAHNLDVQAEIEAHLAAKNLTTADDKNAAGAGTTTTTTTTTVPVALVARKPPSLAHLSLAETCANLERFLSKVHSRRAAPGGEIVQLDCNATRANLQEEYTTAYEEILKLFDDGEQLAEDTKELCLQASKDKHTGHDGTIDEKLTKATRAVQMAKDVISEFQPVLDTAKAQALQLEAHIVSLQTTCVVDDEVTSHLKKVRMLIDSLGKCPGRNDFKLVVPTVTGALPDSVLNAGAGPVPTI